MWCWRRKEKIRRTDRVRNESVLVESRKRKIVYTINAKKANWFGHVFGRDVSSKPHY